MATVQPSELKSLFRVRLRELRVAAGMTQADLAALIGKNQSYVAALETGARSPALKTIAQLSEALKVSPKEFMADEKISA